jgi:hypothetical protein
MKIRTGFVSNSSSSSFCILGKSISQELYNKIEGRLDASYNGLITKCAINDWDDSKYIGMNPNKMNNDETLIQFKQRIVLEINKLTDEPVNINDLEWITDGGYNG